MTGNSSNQSSSAYDFTVKDIRGNDVDLSIYKGKVLLIVNFGCQCEMPNSHYNEINAVYTKYKDQGLEILGLCNQSGGQELGDNVQTAELACTRFEAEFPIFIFDKVEVNCQDIYEFLKPKAGESRKDGLFPTFSYGLKLKFSKFLVDKDGNVKGYFALESLINMEKDVKKLLGIA